MQNDSQVSNNEHINSSDKKRLKTESEQQPITLDKSSSHIEQFLSAKFNTYLKKMDFYEDEAESRRRERILGKLYYIYKMFVYKIYKEVNNNYTGVSQNNNNANADNHNTDGNYINELVNMDDMCKLYTFGSYRLGVHSKGADIDTLCIGPSFLTREIFFKEFYENLSQQKEVTNIIKIEAAYVPIIQLEYDGIKLDLVYASLNVDNFKNIDMNSVQILKGISEKCVMSLNGNRVAEQILKLVPDKTVYHNSLRLIKFWATKKYIYGHSYGYFGGVAFAITVAKICQLYPKANTFTIISKYFELLSKWKWPAPIIIKQIDDIEGINFNLKIWDPQLNYSDKYHKMPVITPVYPSMCSTHNVNSSTQKNFLYELTLASKIMKKILKEVKKIENIDELIKEEVNEKRDTEIFEKFDELFKESDFIENYNNFVFVFLINNNIPSINQNEDNENEMFKNDATKNFNENSISNDTLAEVNPINKKNSENDKYNAIIDSYKQNNDFIAFSSFVSSKIRSLTVKLEGLIEIETAPVLPLKLTLPYEFFKDMLSKFDVYNCSTVDMFVMGVEYSNNITLDTQEVNISTQVNDFIDVLKGSEVYQKEVMDVIIGVGDQRTCIEVFDAFEMIATKFNVSV